MSERLIKNTSLSLNTEKKFITLIKQEVGVYYADKMSKMISDLDRSNKEKEEYNKLKNKSLPSDIKFEPLVILFLEIFLKVFGSLKKNIMKKWQYLLFYLHLLMILKIYINKDIIIILNYFGYMDYLKLK